MFSQNRLQAIVFLVLISIFSLPASAVTDAEFNELKDQFEQLLSAMDEKIASPQKTHIGGYGELHINSLDAPNSPRERKIDLHRFILFVNHEFSDKIRLFSEIEIEHSFLEDTAAGTSSGALEMEQAYLQFEIGESQQINAGLFLIPIGIMNETHEPPTFYGTERNPVEKNIIPTTWWEGGAMWSGRQDSGLSYDIALTSGLSGGTAIRGGRQKVAKAKFDNLALTVRLKYTGISGLEIATSLQKQDDLTQDGTDDIGAATLVETHVIWNVSNLTVKALYAQWNIDGAGAELIEEDEQTGAYLEASYMIMPSFGIFSRYNTWDNGGAGDTKKIQSDFGFNYYPHEDVVVKLDLQAQNIIAGNKDGVNIGIGYQF